MSGNGYWATTRISSPHKHAENLLSLQFCSFPVAKSVINDELCTRIRTFRVLEKSYVMNRTYDHNLV